MKEMSESKRDHIGYICVKEHIFLLGLIDVGNIIYWDKAN